MPAMMTLTPDLILDAYRQGLFPMAYSAHSPHVRWVRPEMRGQLSIPRIHIPGKLRKALNSGRAGGRAYTVTTDTAFAEVIAACGEETAERPETWINDSIAGVYRELHRLGHAHSVEFRVDGRLEGGLYGLALGGAFFGESMFSRTPGASKIALLHLAARLWRGGFVLLDTQFVNPHLLQFGAYEVPDAGYMRQLRRALRLEADFRLEEVPEGDILRAYLAMRRALPG